MEYFLKYSKFFNKAICSNFAKDTPENVIKRFCADFNLSELRYLLWTWFVAAITTDNDAYTNPTARADLLLLYQRLEELLEANMMLSQRYENKIGGEET